MAAAVNKRPVTKKRLFQNKHEAFWFYRFLSIIYDPINESLVWDEGMERDAFAPAELNDPRLKVVDVGGGTGMSASIIARQIEPKNVTILDQSPHQLAKAKKKAAIRDCTMMIGDAENLPFPNDHFDRYTSAGSIEYWPDPQRGIREAYRVLKPGGVACIIGPVRPTSWLSRLMADLWMLFPEEPEYFTWFKKAGFEDVKLARVGPKWYRGVRRHGLIIGCSVTGVKRSPGDSPLQLGPKAEDAKKPSNPFVFLFRFVVGNLAALYFVLVPIYMLIKDKIFPKGIPI